MVKKKKVLITGASGFIGQWLMKHYMDEGYQVTGWGRTAGGHLDLPVEVVDMTEYGDVLCKLKALGFQDIIIHCAGTANVAKSVENPQTDFQGNAILIHNILFSMKECKMEKTRFLFMSSAAVYGNPEEVPIKEESTLRPISPYALHKQLSETICEYFYCNYGFDIKILRIFSVYGPGLRKQIFWDMHSKYAKTGTLKMYGTGLETRDYIYIKDFVRAVMLVGESENGETVYNIGNGESTSIKEAAEIFAECYGIPSNAISFSGQNSEGNPLFWKADISRLEALGYRKRFTLEEGLREYIAWLGGGTHEAVR